MSDAIGAMRARVRLESPTRSADNLGGASISWSSQGDVWAEIAAAGASQSADLDAAPSLSGYTLAINRRGDVRAGWRALWGVRVLRIVGVRDAGAARIELVCEEELR
jgi:head-tail adaptor